MEMKDSDFAKLFVNTGAAFLNAVTLFGAAAESAKQSNILTQQQLQNISHTIAEMAQLKKIIINYLNPVMEQIQACQKPNQNESAIK